MKAYERNRVLDMLNSDKPEKMFEESCERIEEMIDMSNPPTGLMNMYGRKENDAKKGHAGKREEEKKCQAMATVEKHSEPVGRKISREVVRIEARRTQVRKAVMMRAAWRVRKKTKMTRRKRRKRRRRLRK
jgi:hypothetical protein